MSVPPDRSHVETEWRHAASLEFDALSTRDAVALVTEDHRCVSEALAKAGIALAEFIDDLVPRMRAGGRLIYIGAGTSGRLGVLDAAECPPTFQSDPGQVIGIIAAGDRALRRSSEAMEDDPNGAEAALAELRIASRDSVVGIAAGGTTPYVLGAVKIAHERGAMTALLTCAKPAATPEGCDHLLLLETGPELLTGSTRLKAGSATKLALNIITTVAFTKLGKVYSNLMVDLRATNAKLRDRAIRVLQEFAPHLTRAEAAASLERAGGSLKLAIVMQRLNVTLEQAEELLSQHQGVLRAAIEAPKP